jgi:hypothetical protein
MIELLPDEIKRNTFIYRLVKRGEKAMMYEQFCLDAQKVIAWEVFKRKIDPPKEVFGAQLGEREIFPGNEDFGKWAWSPFDLERAEYIFSQLEQGLSHKKDDGDE